jgi:nucleoid-associated protein YgaU
MRRLVGLIALLVLILGAAWLARIDFDLKRIADFDILFEPAGEDHATKTPSKEAAAAPATEPAVVPDTAPAETEVAAALHDDRAENPPGMATEATAASAPEPTESVTASPSKSAETTAEPAAPGAETATTPATSSAESETAAAAPAGAAEVEPPVVVVPRFDIVRVEPTGETVIAGVSEPEAMVEILNGPEPVATAEANKRGEWALVLDVPLPPGTHDLGIRTTSQGRSRPTLSDQRVAVSVPESVDEEPLVVLNQPNAPSRVLQVPSGASAAVGPKVAAASKPQADVKTRQSSPAGTEIAAPQPEAPATEAEVRTAASPSALSRAGPETASAGTEVASAPQSKPMAESSVPSDAPVSSAAPPAMAPAAESVSETAAASPEAVPAPAPFEKAGIASPSAAPAAKGGSEMMAVTPETSAAGTAAAGVSAARRGPPASVGEATSEGPPSSEPSAPTGMAATSPSLKDPSAETAAAGPAATESEVESAVVAETPPPPKVGVAAVEAETNGALYIAGTATTPEPIRVYVDDEFLGEATPTEFGTWLLETKRELAPDEYTIRADQVDAGSGIVVARAEVPFEREIAVAALKPVGEPVAAGTAEASGSVAGPMTVIIKRGDNLWRISREMYGHGIRYSTIYRANRDQIRNPHRIYPGQVFVLPAGDTSWQD